MPLLFLSVTLSSPVKCYVEWCNSNLCVRGKHLVLNKLPSIPTSSGLAHCWQWGTPLEARQGISGSVSHLRGHLIKRETPWGNICQHIGWGTRWSSVSCPWLVQQPGGSDAQQKHMRKLYYPVYLACARWKAQGMAMCGGNPTSPVNVLTTGILSSLRWLFLGKIPPFSLNLFACCITFPLREILLTSQWSVF